MNFGSRTTPGAERRVGGEVFIETFFAAMFVICVINISVNDLVML